MQADENSAVKSRGGEIFPCSSIQSYYVDVSATNWLGHPTLYSVYRIAPDYKNSIQDVHSFQAYRVSKELEKDQAETELKEVLLHCGIQPENIYKFDEN